MIIFVLAIYGLCLGSFVNALVWRIYEQEKSLKKGKSDTSFKHRLSISKGRSMCPRCKHGLSALDLIPVISWLSLGGKCRYCKQPISIQYPIIEVLTAVLFVLSYVYWPNHFSMGEIAQFVCWLVILVGFIALAIYDAKWMLLPNRIIHPLWAVAALTVLIRIASSDKPFTTTVTSLLAVAVGGGVFMALFYISNGKWIGYGDVRLGWIIGAVVASPGLSLMVIFVASFLGCVFALPAVISKKLKGSSEIPFGPFLIVATVVVKLFGIVLLHEYIQLVTS